MIPSYQENEDILEIKERTSHHFPPHLHQSMELVYVRKGTLELGVGIDLYHMEEGDLALIFPNLIHHAQVFDSTPGRAVHVLASPSYLSTYAEILKAKRPVNPIIKKEKIHHDVCYALGSLLTEYKDLPYKEKLVISHAWFQIILVRTLPFLELKERSDPKSFDLVYQSMTYIGEHFQEDITQEQMAKDLGISVYDLSRLFTSTFHQNFRRYLNQVRLSHAIVLLTETGLPVTEIFLEVGFQSQATFNRVFMEEYHMTPREYRQQAFGDHNRGRFSADNTVL